MARHYDDHISAFKRELQRLGYSKGSCRMLPACVSDFLRTRRPLSLGEVSPSDIEAFREELLERPKRTGEGSLSEKYVHHHLYALRLFFAWLQRRGLVERDPVSPLRFPGPSSPGREPLTRGEVRELFAACERLQETALLHLGYSCGLRRSEIAALDLHDLRLREGLLHVRKGKGAKRRTVPFTERVGADLERYLLSGRRRRRVHAPEAFLINRVGGRMSGDSCNRLFKRVLARTTIARPVSLHHLRHSVATHLLERGLAVERVRELLGHRHLEATHIYTHVRPRQTREL